MLRKDDILKEQFKQEFENKNKKPTFRLYKEVINNSSSSSFMMATKEWEIIDYQVTEAEYCCICGHAHLKKIYKIKNKITNKILFPIGANCIDYFSDEKIKEEAKRIAELEKFKQRIKNINADTSPYNFYLKTFYDELTNQIGFQIIEKTVNNTVRYIQCFDKDKTKSLESELLKYKCFGIMYVISLAQLNNLANVKLHIVNSRKIKRIIEGEYDLLNPDIINFNIFCKKHLGRIIITELDKKEYNKIKVLKPTILLNKNNKEI